MDHTESRVGAAPRPVQVAARLLVTLAASIFAAEALLMLVLSALSPLPRVAEMLFDAVALITLLSPALYWLMFRPLRGALARVNTAADENALLLTAIEQAHEITDVAGRIGEYRRLEDNLVPQLDERGRPIAFFDTAREVTLSVTAERELETSAERYRLLFDSNPQPMWVYDAESLGFLAVNATAVRTYGYAREEFLGMTIRDIRPPEDVPRLETFAHVLSGGLVQSTGWRHIKKDGGMIDVEISSHEITFAGRRARLVVVQDVTKRRAAEAEQSRLQAALEAAAAQWQRTFDAMTEAVVIVDSRGLVQRLNRSAAAVVRAGEAVCLGVPLAQLGPGQPWERAAALAADVARGGESAGCRVRGEPDGVWWDLSATPMPAVEQEGSVIVVARDVTQTVELQESVRRSEKMVAMGAIVAGVAHEVRNPLFAISANLDALEVTPVDDDVAEVLAAVRSEVSRLGVLMKDLIEYGKPADSALGVGSLDLPIALALQSAAGLAEAAGVAVCSHVAPGAWSLRMNCGRLAQVFDNLLRNAIQHSPRGGAVSVRAEAFRHLGRDWVRCLIADEGSGFRYEDLPRIFDPFFSRRRGGTGLGLAIVQRVVVEEHCGRIAACNGDARGAVVVVELPCVASGERTSPGPESPIQQRAGQAGAGRRIVDSAGEA